MINGVLDAILGLVLLEGLGLVLLRRATGRGLSSRALIATLAAGFFLVLAWRLASGGALTIAILGCLLAALVAHVLDLAGRWTD